MLTLLTLWGCSSPPTKPADPLAEDLRLLRRDIGLARRSPELACDVLGRTRALAPRVADALADGRSPDTLSLLGLSVHPTRVSPDWPELGLALGEGPLTTAVVTVGGLDDLLDRPCVPPKSLDSWTRRIPQLYELDDCNHAVLSAALVDTLAALRDRCTCAPVDPILASRLGTRTHKLAPELSERLKTWDQDGTVCAPTEGPAGSPAPSGPPSP